MKIPYWNILQIVVLIIALLPNVKVNSQANYPETNFPALTKIDSIYASKIPKIELPESYLNGNRQSLPYEINNADLPFFRPVFSQEEYWNCGQSAGVGYNFCYEINQSRNLSGGLPENQYSVNFSYNFNNTGAGWGVSYFHSFDVLKYCGSPNLLDYGGLFTGGERRWMSGYDLYENAMRNRIREAYSIDVGTPEGLQTLKHWLNDHMNGSQYGGVANFYFGRWWSTYLTDDSPEPGQWTVVECSAPATHALTVVGYNDSIRFDVNFDGRYTNDEDINDDGIIDMKDWEIGGLKYINSILFNEGYGLIMYRTLAMKYGEGGIWNNQVHVVEVKDEYEPLATMRVKIKHDSRNKLKLIAGVSQDTNSNSPQHSIDFPIFNYQGGDYYMQGYNTNESYKTIELSLDITPLLSYIKPGFPAKYFLQIAEKDEFEEGEGEVQYFSVVDVQNSSHEDIAQNMPKAIANNSLTSLSVVSELNFGKVSITTEELLAVVPGETSSCQISADGGQPPYRWEVIQPYSLNTIPLDFPDEQSEQLTFVEDSFYGIPIDLPFNFSFYNDTVDKITVFKDGFIMFDDAPYPYPYYVGEETMLRNRRAIAPFMTELVLVEADNDGVWVNRNSDFTEIIWKASFEWFENGSNVEFSVKLFPDGKIETHYDEMDFPAARTWCSGISNGDKINYTPNLFEYQLGDLSSKAYEYKPPQILPDQILIDQNGLLSMFIPDDSELFDIVVQASDDYGITDRKNFQVPSEIIFDYEISAGNDDKVNYFDTVSVKFTVKNISPEVCQNAAFTFSVDDPHFSVIKDYAHIGEIMPEQTKVIDSALILVAYPGIPDQHTTNISSILSSDEKEWITHISLVSNSPHFKTSEIRVDDNQNGFLDPGETADLEIGLSNTGHMNIEDFTVNLSSDDNILLVEDSTFYINQLNIDDTIMIRYTVKAKENLQTGIYSSIQLKIKQEDYLLSTMDKMLMIGKIPVLILDLETSYESGPVLRELFDELQLTYDYTTTYKYDYDNYMSVFICLGKLFNNVEISVSQANKLSSFLLNGGNIYLEGRETWLHGEPENLLSYFKISTETNGNYFVYDSIYGITGSLSEDMTFGYTSTIPYNNHYLIPSTNAFPVFNSASSDSACVIAYDDGNYKTIGSAIEFGSLVDTDSTSTKKNYLLGILDFFDLTDYLLWENQNVASIIDEQKILAYPNPFHDFINIEVEGTLNNPSYMQIYDLSGRLVFAKQISKNNNQASIITTTWNGKDQTGNNLPKGMYFIRIRLDNSSIFKKILLH